MVVREITYGLGILLASIVMATMVHAVTQKIIIDIPGSFVLNGKNISVMGIGNAMISVDVDGVLTNVEEDRTSNEAKFVNGVYIQIIALSKSPTRAVLNVTVNINCGNNVCENGEDFSICCADCGCSGTTQVCNSNRCMENITQSTAKNQCFVDADCDDKNTCTTERCDTSEFPNRCIRADVSACVAGDQCCPKLCDTDRDADCAQVDKCETAADCVDNEACTTETCTGAPKRCQYTNTEGCGYQGVCIVKGTVKEGSYCEGKSHEWLPQKVDKQACVEGSECITAVCDGGVCGRNESNMIQYAFYTIALIAIIIVTWSVAITRKANVSNRDKL